MKWNGPTVRAERAERIERSGRIQPEISASICARELRATTSTEKWPISPTKAASSIWKESSTPKGEGADLLDSAHAEGTLRGRSILFAPDAEFRSVTARFEMQGGGAASRWKLSNVEVNQSGESLAGTGASQADGRMVLDLISRGRPLRYTGTLFTSRRSNGIAAQRSVELARAAARCSRSRVRRRRC